MIINYQQHEAMGSGASKASKGRDLIIDGLE
jgi:hypothetical protein